MCIVAGCRCDSRDRDGTDGGAPDSAAESPLDDASRPDASNAVRDGAVVPMDAAVPADSAAIDAASDAQVAIDAADAQPVSEFCGDAIRDPVLEECDDGPGDEQDSCNADSQVSDLFAVEMNDDAGVVAGLGRSLGTGPHVAAAGPNGFSVAYIEHDPQPTVWLQPFDAEAVTCEHAGDGIGGERDLDDAHAAVAAVAGVTSSANTRRKSHAHG